MTPMERACLEFGSCDDPVDMKLCRATVHAYLEAIAEDQATTPRAMEGDARETWAFIERVLVEECGLLADQGLSSQRENFISAITNLAGDELLKAASDFLAVPSLARVRVAGRMMSREDVSAAIAGRRVGTDGDAIPMEQAIAAIGNAASGNPKAPLNLDYQQCRFIAFVLEPWLRLTRHSTATQADGGTK